MACARGGPLTAGALAGEALGTDRFRLAIFCADATLLLRTARGPLAIHAPRVTNAIYRSAGSRREEQLEPAGEGA